MDIVGRRRQENALAGLTLTAVLTNETPPQQPRTLFDIIQEDKGGKENRKKWKSFKEKIRLKRAGSAWTSTVPIPASDVVVQQSGNRTITRTRFSNIPKAEDSDSNSDPDSPRSEERGSGGRGNKTNTVLLRGNSIRASQRPPVRMMVRETVTDEWGEEDEEFLGEEEGEEGEEEEEESQGEEDEMAAMVGRGKKEPRVNMSLMSLLAETDKEMGIDGEKYTGGEEEEEEQEEEDEEGGGGGGGEYSNCCVCRVRHKGAPFVPCGHTFCRLCSRELFVQRGSCPLCTNYILEILDIF